MTIIRRISVGISQRVVRWAAPGCKDWAEGLEREVAFIEGDWRALGWALSSTRVLVDRRSTTSARPPLWRAWVITMVVQTLCSWTDFHRGHGWHDRIGSGLIAFGWTCWTTFSIADILWEGNRPSISELRAYHLFSRATLQRRLEHYRSPRRWLELSIPVSMCVGYAMNFEGWGRPERQFGAIVVGLLALWMLCLDTPAKIQQRIERVDALMEGAQPQPCLDIQRLPIKRLQSDHGGRTELPQPRDPRSAESGRWL